VLLQPFSQLHLTLPSVCVCVCVCVCVRVRARACVCVCVCARGRRCEPAKAQLTHTESVHMRSYTTPHLRVVVVAAMVALTHVLLAPAQAPKHAHGHEHTHMHTSTTTPPAWRGGGRTGRTGALSAGPCSSSKTRTRTQTHTPQHHPPTCVARWWSHRSHRRTFCWLLLNPPRGWRGTG